STPPPPGRVPTATAPPASPETVPRARTATEAALPAPPRTAKRARPPRRRRTPPPDQPLPRRSAGVMRAHALATRKHSYHLEPARSEEHTSELQSRENLV